MGSVLRDLVLVPVLVTLPMLTGAGEGRVSQNRAAAPGALVSCVNGGWRGAAAAACVRGFA